MSTPIGKGVKSMLQELLTYRLTYAAISTVLLIVLGNGARAADCSTLQETEKPRYRAEQVAVEKVVQGFMKLEGKGGSRSAHVDYYGNLYNPYHAEPIIVYGDGAFINGYRIVQICPADDQNHEQYIATVKIDLLAIGEGRSMVGNSSYGGYSKAPYINARGKNEDPRLDYAQAVVCNASSRILVPRGRNYFINLQIKKDGKRWLVVNGMEWREMSNGTRSRLLEIGERENQRLVSARKDIQIITKNVDAEKNVDRRKGLEAAKRDAQWREAGFERAIECNNKLLALHETLLQRGD